MAVLGVEGDGAREMTFEGWRELREECRVLMHIDRPEAVERGQGRREHHDEKH